MDNVLTQSSLVYPPITMFCEKCSMERTFKITFSPSVIEESVYKIIYKCAACNEFKLIFIVYISWSNHTIMKLTQWPLWLPKIEAELQKSLGRNIGNYKKGLYCEQEGVAEKKIEIVKKILPSELISNGINPFDRLHSSLSEGLHSKSDDECLKIATVVRISLSHLLHEIVLRKNRRKNYVSAMKELEKQTKTKKISK